MAMVVVLQGLVLQGLQVLVFWLVVVVVVS